MTRRDRHGRRPDVRAVPRTSPGFRTPSQMFDDAILDAVDSIDPRWEPSIDALEFAVEAVPSFDMSLIRSREIPLGRLYPAHGRRPGRVVLYRRPIQMRSATVRELQAIVREVVYEQVAAALNVSPHELS